MRAAIWARVSTKLEQDPENQISALRAMAEGRGWEVVKVYEVRVSAYYGFQKEPLQVAYEDARQGKYDVLLIWDLSRLSRGGIVELLSIVHDFEAVGIRVESLQESVINTHAGPMREFMLSVFTI